MGLRVIQDTSGSKGDSAERRPTERRNCRTCRPNASHKGVLQAPIRRGAIDLCATAGDTLAGVTARSKAARRIGACASAAAGPRAGRTIAEPRATHASIEHKFHCRQDGQDK